jgi:glycosyltransferase involved in cell wall biosynthesis
MRIALVVAGGVDRSGRERVIPVLLSLVERLARRHDVRIYVLRYLEQPCTYSLLGATVHDLGRPRGIRRQYAALVEALRRDGDVEVLHGYWGLPSGVVAVAAGRRLGIPSLVTCDSGEFVSVPELGYGSQYGLRQRLAIAAMCRYASAVTVGSEYHAGLARALGIEPTILPIGVDCTAFTPGPRAEGPPWRLINVARQHPVKAQDMLLRAVRQLVSRGVDVHLDLVGEDTLHGLLQSFAVKLGLQEHVTFHGFLPTDAVIPLYQRAHIALLTSLHEAAPVSILEAAACGTPVAGTAVGFVADWAPERAVAVPCGAAESLADAVHTLIANPCDARRWPDRPANGFARTMRTGRPTASSGCRRRLKKSPG